MDTVIVTTDNHLTKTKLEFDKFVENEVGRVIYTKEMNYKLPYKMIFKTVKEIKNTDIENLKLFASFVTDVNTVAVDGTADTRDVLLNASYKVMPELKVTAYGYLLGSQHDTYGLALTGKVGVADGVNVSYRAEYATQTDPSMEKSGTDNNDFKADADYYRLGLGVNANGILAGVCYESLSGDDGSTDSSAFHTPYATLHGQNGWADMFLATNGAPTDGLEDMSAYIGYKSKDLGLIKVVYHDFQSEVGSTDYGTEVDAVYKRAIPGVNGLVGLLKVADYDADNGVGGYGTDTTKFWVMLDYKFASK